jgi:hypothetical protein
VEVGRDRALGEAELVGRGLVGVASTTLRIRSIFKKLGVGSRRELAAAMAKSPEPLSSEPWPVGWACPYFGADPRDVDTQWPKTRRGSARDGHAVGGGARTDRR